MFFPPAGLHLTTHNTRHHIEVSAARAVVDLLTCEHQTKVGCSQRSEDFHFSVLASPKSTTQHASGMVIDDSAMLVATMNVKTPECRHGNRECNPIDATLLLASTNRLELAATRFSCCPRSAVSAGAASLCHSHGQQYIADS